MICAGELNVEEAQVVCATTAEMFLRDLTRVAVSNVTTTTSVFYRGSVQCTGEEADISQCSVSMDPVTRCPSGFVQRITCTSCEYA